MAAYKPLMPTNKLMKALLIFIILFSINQASAEVKLPRLIRDSMVLQRDVKIKIWGWATRGEKINVKLNGKKFNTTTGADGKWSVLLSPMKAGGPYTMDISGNNKITLKDILIGDVWICSGQSNIVHQMELHNIKYAKDIEQANYPQIRHFWIPIMTDLKGPHDDLPMGYWRSANPNDVRQFSAVAYFFAKHIHEKYNVPVGLINASVGGTPVEAWTSEDGFKEFPQVLNTINKNKDTGYINGINRRALLSNADRPKQQDKGLTGAKPWYDTTYIPKGWRDIYIPGYWEDQGTRDLDGIVWYRREIEIPRSMTGVPAKIFLGRIVDADHLYVNGNLAGNTSYQYPQRRYTLPAGMLKPGKNILVIRVINNSGKGGFVPGKPYSISAGSQTIALTGAWQYKVGDIFIPNRNIVPGISAQNQPTALYNAMVAPLTNYTIKGFLWYQGESNTSKAAEYDETFPALIKDWRNLWKLGDLPFLYVQLPGFMEVNYLPSESQWAILREAQLKTLSLPNTAMAIAIDLGEWNDIHPGNKKDVGIRLALGAEKIAYGKNIVHSGPLYQSSKIEGNKIIISFSNTGSGLITNDDEELRWFAIAGADKKFVWANAKIESGNVIVWNDDIQNPMYIRYAWADNPDGANLYNKEGLPASPFRTDK